MYILDSQDNLFGKLTPSFDYQSFIPPPQLFDYFHISMYIGAGFNESLKEPFKVSHGT